MPELTSPDPGVGIVVAWLGIVLTLAASGILKLSYKNNLGDALKVLGVPGEALRQTIRRVLPFAELGLAAWLASGIRPDLASLATLIMIAAFNVTLWVLGARGYQGGCGCFGEDSTGPVRRIHMARNVVLLIAAGVLMLKFRPDDWFPMALWQVPAMSLLLAVGVLLLLWGIYLVAAAAERLLFRAYWR